MALQAEHRILRVEARDDGILLLEEHRSEQVGGFLRQDERCSHPVLHLGLVLHQLVRIRAHERERVLRDADVDAVHHGPQLVVGRGEDGLVDAADERVHVERKLLLLGAQLRHGRIAHGARARNRERTALPLDADLPILVVDVDRQRNLRKLLQRVEHQLGRRGDRALALYVVHRDGADERGFEVRGGYFEFAVLELHEEIVEDRQRILVADNLARGRQKREQGRT